MSMSKSDIKYLESVNTRYTEDMSDKKKKILAKSVSRYFHNKFTNIRTVSIKISQSKKYFKEKYPNDKSFFGNISPNKNITKELAKMSKDKLENASFFRTIDKGFVDNIIKRWKASDCKHELLVYLLLVTGRRINEILITGEVSESENKNSIHFTGLLKKRSKAAKSTDIYVLDEASEVLKAFERFKIKLNKSKNVKSFQRTFQNKLKVIIQKYVLTTHDLRSIYANYMFQFNNPTNQIYNSCIKKVLNHANIFSSVNYSSIKLSN